MAILELLLLFMVALALMGTSVDDGEVRSVADDDNSYMDEALYVGSDTCVDCHEEQGDPWYGTPHAGAFGNATVETVVGDFTAEPTFEVAPGVSVTPELIGNETGFYMDLDGEGTHVYRVTHVQGAGLWLQVYLSEQGSTRYLLPYAWGSSIQQWVPFEIEEWFGVANVPHMAGKDHVWDLKCVACHVVGARVEHNDTSGEWVATWEEDGVGCEACHGPGSLHKRPPSGEERNDYIWGTEDSDVCGNCHAGQTPVGTVAGMKTGYPLSADGRTIRPGDTHEEFFTHTPELHPDGETAVGQSHEFSDYMTSSHAHSLTTLQEAVDRQDSCLVCHSTDYRLAEEGEEPTLETARHDIECPACHDMHGTEEENNLRRDKWDTCVQCHRNGDLVPPEDPLPSQKEMVMGTIPIEGLQWFPWMEGEVLCTDCHMPAMGVRVVPYDIPSHTWRFIGPDKSIDLGMPNSCTVSCHHAGSEEGLMSDEKALEWVDTWRANSEQWMIRAMDNLSVADDRLVDAPGLGFDADVIAEMNDTFQEALWVYKFVQRDASMVHNPDFYQLLLGHSNDLAISVGQNLTPGGVKGTVENAEGKAVSGAEVRKDDQVWGTTGEDGSFEFDIAPGDQTFDVYRSNSKEARFTVSVTAGEMEDAGTIKFQAEGDGDDDNATVFLIVGLAMVIIAIAVIIQTRKKAGGAKEE
jgi:predicted CXXCH cytochrome family protein